ncbi:MAG: NADH:flavin oxidoreductase [Microthrixaceae bacterium]
MGERIVQVKRLRSVGEFRAHLADLGAELPVADSVDPAGALAQPLQGCGGVLGERIANRWAILPMEGWDATAEGRPSELVQRRWRRFGESGAALIWGGEAVAVVPEGRANPHQLCIGANSIGDLAALREELLGAHARVHGRASADRVVVGLQLTHSGRWSRPTGEPAPMTAHTDPLLDERVGAGAHCVVSDAYLEELVGSFVHAATVAHEAGFDFVDVKQCHGYLGHELLSGVGRPGPYGGDLAGRSRWVTSVLRAIRLAVPAMGLASRLSLYDMSPHLRGPDGTGVPAPGPRFCFGGDAAVGGVDLAETHELIDALAREGAELLCATAASPYYAPHGQRPAYFPPSDGYAPPQDPLLQVAAMAAATREVSARHPGLLVVGSGLTYCQDHLPNVAQALVEQGWMDVAGIGRMALSAPGLPADTLAGRPTERRRVCRTFSDCTTAPRHGLVSGCYPLDEFYRERPERTRLAAVKRGLRGESSPRGRARGPEGDGGDGR